MSDRLSLIRRQLATLRARPERSEDCAAAIARLEAEAALLDGSAPDPLHTALARIAELEEALAKATAPKKPTKKPAKKTK